MFENNAPTGGDAESRQGSAKQEVFTIASMDEFKPLQVADSKLGEPNHLSDLWAGYSQKTIDALTSFDNGDINSFVKQFKDADPETREQLSTALRTAGITTRQDGDTFRMILNEKDRPGFTKTLAFKPDGSVVPELSAKDPMLNAKLISQKESIAGSPEILQATTSSFVKAIKNRPEVRRA